MATKAARAAMRRVDNPPNPWHHTAVEHLGPPPEAELELFEDRTRSALSRNDSPDVGFEFSVNPYRGCYHGCAYCYARPSHQYLDFGAGTDFERKLVYKPAIAAHLRAAFERPRWRGDSVAFSGNTDCYQPLEASMGLTRACLRVCLEYRNPVGIVTKSALIERDLELLAELSRTAYCAVSVSIPFHDPDDARAIEPWAPSPERRYKTIERLARAGIPVGVLAAPVIPGLTDSALPAILTRAREAGARWAGATMVRLPGPVAAVFERRLRALMPLRAERILAAIREARGGATSDSRFGDRMRGQGERWRTIEGLIAGLEARLGYGRAPEVPDPSPFCRPRSRSLQLPLL